MTTRKEVAGMREAARMLISKEALSLTDAAEELDGGWQFLERLYSAKNPGESIWHESTELKAMFALFVAEAYERGDL